MIDKDLPVDSEDEFHGTAVTSLIVDGGTINPELDDGCGHFRVKHFGVAKKGFNSSSFIMDTIEKIVENNDEAIVEFDLAIKYKPNYFEAYFNKGISLVNLSKHNEALESYEKCLEIS